MRSAFLVDVPVTIRKPSSPVSSRLSSRLTTQVLSANDPLQHEKLSRHTSQNPMQANPISDTATLLHGATRTPSPSYSFHPVGHVSLDSSNADSPNADPTLAEAPEHIYHITSLYISQALQGTGLGRAAMDAVEAQAVRYPLFAKVLTLDTLARELYFELSDRYEAYGWEKPKVRYIPLRLEAAAKEEVDNQSGLVCTEGLRNL